VSEDVERRLRRASDDVRASVRSVMPRPLEDLDRRPGRGVLAVGVTVMLVVGLLVVAGQRHDPSMRAETFSTTLQETARSRTCRAVVAIAGDMVDAPRSVDAWLDVSVSLDRLASMIDEAERTGELGADDVRRLRRFGAYGRDAAAAGESGGFGATGLPAGQATILAEVIVRDLPVSGCHMPTATDLPKRSDDGGD
jgi:hypothetical protein